MSKRDGRVPGWVPLAEATAQREDFSDALRRLGDQVTMVAAEFRALESRWREENGG